MASAKAIKEAQAIIDKVNDSSVLDAMYRLLWKEYVKEDVSERIIENYCDTFKNEGEVDEVIDVVAERICFNGDYDCNASYWEQIDALLEDEAKWE